MEVYNQCAMHRIRAFIIICVLAAGGVLLMFQSALVVSGADAAVVSQATPTFDVSRLTQPPTVYPPVQADNGEQTYWGMCMSCHGDHAQGLTGEWRDSYPVEERDCWQSGCHGGDVPENSFSIPESGIPSLAGAGRLSRFENSHELFAYIRQNMPYFRAGALTTDDAWALTAFLLRINDRQVDAFTLKEANGAAIPVHRTVTPPSGGIPGALLLAGVLTLAAVGWSRKRTGTLAVKPNFFHHLHPPSIPAEQSRFRYTLAAGGLAVFLSLILFVTGLLEMYYYVPTPAEASVSIQTINTLVPFGGLVRNLHFWSAQFLVIVATAHLLRVVLTGAYAQPRRFNHLLGVGLLAIILLLNFTGYILRWDEGIHWALVVGANLLKTIPLIGGGLYRFLLGGNEPGAATLTRFYAWHIFGLTAGAFILMAWHAFRVRRDGGIALPPTALRRDKERITRFDLLHRETLAMLIVLSILVLFSLLLPAPLEAPINDLKSISGDSRAPWFFLWVQQLLVLGDPFVFGVLPPVLAVLVFGVLPYILPNAASTELGRWFPRGNRLAQGITVALLLVIFLLTLWGALQP